MKKGLFLRGLKMLTSFYRIHPDEEDIEDYYSYLQSMDEEVYVKAIENLINLRENILPTPARVVEECEKIYESYKYDILKKMYDDGYFHKGVERLTDEHASRNYDKAMTFVSRGIIPGFLLEDMIAYGLKQKPSLSLSQMLLLEDSKKND